MDSNRIKFYRAYCAALKAEMEAHPEDFKWTWTDDNGQRYAACTTLAAPSKMVIIESKTQQAAMLECGIKKFNSKALIEFLLADIPVEARGAYTTVHVDVMRSAAGVINMEDAINAVDKFLQGNFGDWDHTVDRCSWGSAVGKYKGRDDKDIFVVATYVGVTTVTDILEVKKV